MACIDGRTTAAKINYSEMRRDTFIKVYALSMDYNLKFHSRFTDYLLFTSQIIFMQIYVRNDCLDKGTSIIGAENLDTIN